MKRKSQFKSYAAGLEKSQSISNKRIKASMRDATMRKRSHCTRYLPTLRGDLQFCQKVKSSSKVSYIDKQ